MFAIKTKEERDLRVALKDAGASERHVDGIVNLLTQLDGNNKEQLRNGFANLARTTNEMTKYGVGKEWVGILTSANDPRCKPAYNQIIMKFVRAEMEDKVKGAALSVLRDSEKFRMHGATG